MSEDIREEISRTAGAVLWNAGNYPRKAQPHMLGQDTAPLRDLVVDALMPLVARIQADAVRHVLDGTILSMGDVKTSKGWTRGVSVYDSREHYDRGLPRPTEIHEWLRARADRLEQGDPS